MDRRKWQAVAENGGPVQRAGARKEPRRPTVVNDVSRHRPGAVRPRRRALAAGRRPHTRAGTLLKSADPHGASRRPRTRARTFRVDPSGRGVPRRECRRTRAPGPRCRRAACPVRSRLERERRGRRARRRTPVILLATGIDPHVIQPLLRFFCRFVALVSRTNQHGGAAADDGAAGESSNEGAVAKW